MTTAKITNVPIINAECGYCAAAIENDYGSCDLRLGDDCQHDESGYKIACVNCGRVNRFPKTARI